MNKNMSLMVFGIKFKLENVKILPNIFKIESYKLSLSSILLILKFDILFCKFVFGVTITGGVITGAQVKLA
jgi:hypothetical protein